MEDEFRQIWCQMSDAERYVDVREVSIFRLTNIIPKTTDYEHLLCA